MSTSFCSEHAHFEKCRSPNLMRMLSTEKPYWYSSSSSDLKVPIRELKKTRRRRRGHQLESDFISYLRISRYLLKSFTLFITAKAITKLNLGHRDKFEIQISKLN